MYLMRESWTDERLDDFRDEVNRRFDKFEGEVDKKFDKVDKRFDNVDHELNRVNDRLDAMHRVMVQAIVATFGSTLAGFLMLAGLILTH
jgi:hypothetical protein